MKIHRPETESNKATDMYPIPSCCIRLFYQQDAYVFEVANADKFLEHPNLLGVSFLVMDRRILQIGFHSHDSIADEYADTIFSFPARRSFLRGGLQKYSFQVVNFRIECTRSPSRLAKVLKLISLCN